MKASRNAGESYTPCAIEEEPRPISVEKARQIDRDAVQRYAMPTLLLMENAARGIADAARELGNRFIILCGPGNNGGDGMAAARHLGREARVFLLAEPNAGTDAARQLRILRCAGMDVSVGARPRDLGEGDQVWIDALFGTGLSRPLVGEAAAWVEIFNAVHGPKLSVDIPSGLHGDTGQVLGVACRADLTVTFEAPKLGLTQPVAAEYVGRTLVVGLGLPPCGCSA